MKSVLVPLYVALWGVCGCGSKATEPPPPTVPTQGIELVKPGVMPQQPLRYRLAKGAKATMEMVMDVEIHMGTTHQVMPTGVMVMEVHTDDVLPDGNAKVRTVILHATARDRPGSTVPLETMIAQSMLVNGMEMTATLTPRGKLTDSKLVTKKDMPESATTQYGPLMQNFEQVAMPLPDPPIGVGAVWRNRKTVVQEQVKMETITELEITAIDGDKITFVSKLEVKGDKQTIDLGTAKVDITNVGGGGSGKGVIDLAHMVMSGELQAEFRFDASMKDAAGQLQTSPMQMKVSTRLRTPAEITAGTTPTPAINPDSKSRPEVPPTKKGKPAHDPAHDHADPKPPVAPPIEKPAGQGEQSAP